MVLSCSILCALWNHMSIFSVLGKLVLLHFSQLWAFYLSFPIAIKYLQEFPTLLALVTHPAPSLPSLWSQPVSGFILRSFILVTYDFEMAVSKLSKSCISSIRWFSFNSGFTSDGISFSFVLVFYLYWPIILISAFYKMPRGLFTWWKGGNMITCVIIT